VSKTESDDFGDFGCLRPASDPYSFLLRSNLLCQNWAIWVLWNEQKKGTPSASERLAIDDEIEKFELGAVSAKSKRFTDITLAEIGPYFYARWLLHQAIGLAAARYPKDSQRRKEGLAELANHLVQTRKSINSCLNLIESFGGCPDGEGGLPNELRTNRWETLVVAEQDLTKVLPAIDLMISATKDDLSRVDAGPGRPREEWKTLFVTALAIGWDMLTGQLPGQTTTSGPFVDFVNAAWNSMPGANAPIVNWERPIRRSVLRARVLCDEIAEIMVKDRNLIIELHRIISDEKTDSEVRLSARKQLNYYTNPFSRLRSLSRLS
jgi:hypothetical protein